MTATPPSHPAMQRLVAEHGVIASMMTALDGEIASLESTGAFDIDLVRLILRYMGEYPDRFHHPKEEALFDIAAARDAGFTRLASGIRTEHADLPAVTEELQGILQTIELGQSMPRDEVLARLRSYSDSQRAHMATERDEIFPALEKILSEADWAEGEARARAIEDPLGGGQDPGPYRRLQALILPAAA